MSGTAEAVAQLTREINRAAPVTVAPTHVQPVRIVDTPANVMESLSNLVAPLARPVGTAAVVVV